MSIQLFFNDVFSNIQIPFEKTSKYYEDSRQLVVEPIFYTNYSEVLSFFDLIERGLLPQQYYISLKEISVQNEILQVFKFLYFSKDWETFYKNTLWAREHVNEQIFVYALKSVIQQRHEFSNIEIPSQDDIFPFYFYTNNISGTFSEEKIWNDFKINYLLEDVELNLYNFNMNLHFFGITSNFNEKSCKKNLNNLFFYWLQQCLARYNLEYLSELEEDIADYESVFLNDLTNRQLKKIYFENLNLIANNNTLLHEFINFLRHFHINSKQLVLHEGKIKIVPHLLEQTETQMRDPLFYQISKLLLNIYFMLKPSEFYNKEDLSFPGVKLKIKVSELKTFMETVHKKIKTVDFRNDFNYSSVPEFLTFYFKRLNNEPFEVIYQINSELLFNTRVYIQLFVAPIANCKRKTSNLFDKQANFFKIDQFLYNLQPGKTYFTRNSQNFFAAVDNYTKEDNFNYKSYETSRNYWFPKRLNLPKSNTRGIQFLAIISEVTSKYGEILNEESKNEDYCESTLFYKLDGRNIGFPFDRYIMHDAFDVSNIATTISLVNHITK
ncbi:arylphorin subunit C223-like [Condylostylus longicornis]|uniref:arylphorin subunit C223-like n=1 Tax=Condylostylus longicornis TaxID=2530218 RepID=UPI00244DE1A9|nr:arylphorin subunit C223-like [Condylostylus longicornis]